MNQTKNRHIYRREGVKLVYVTTALASSPETACERSVEAPGKYVVTDLDFTEITQVYVTLSAVGR